MTREDIAAQLYISYITQKGLLNNHGLIGDQMETRRTLTNLAHNCFTAAEIFSYAVPDDEFELSEEATATLTKEWRNKNAI
jgi:hypothetical protein